MKKRTKLILTALIVAALLMTTGFLLGGNSTLLERIKSAGASTASSAQLYSDDCYISSIEKGSVVTGTEYWDTGVDDETSSSYTAGYDGNDTNDIVRSFDYITYNYIYTTSGSSNDATLLVELTLECSPAVARFYTEGMKWIDSSTTTYYENGETNDSYDDINAVTKQVITAEYSLGNLSGATTNNLEIIIFTTNAENGTQIAPTFNVSIKGNYTDKVKTIEPDPVTVSSVVGDYYIKFAQASNMNVIGTYDFTTNNYEQTYSGQTCTVAVTSDTPNYSYGEATGRMQGFGVTVIMENINTSKGIKGLYFPTTDIEFDITLSTSSTSGGSNDIGLESGYEPIMWDYYENTRYSWFGKWGRQFVRHNGYAYAAAPFNKLYCHTYSTIYDSCYDGGTWTITQTGPYTYHVVISDYAIDLENVIFPTADNTYFTRTTSGSTYKANQFCISAGSLQILLQYPSSYTADDRDGKTWYLGLEASSLTVKDVDSPTLSSKSYLYQSISLLTSLKISQSGCNFMDKDSTAHSNNGAGLMLGSSYDSKDAYAYLYKTIKIWQKVAVSYDDDVRTVIGFIKWDDRGLSVDTSNSCSVSTGVTCESYSTYFAGRRNGWNETTDEATDTIMNAAHLSNSTDEEYSIVFFESVEKLEAAGYTCVGVLFIAQYAKGAYNPDQTTSFPMFCCPLKTTSDTELLNNVYDAMADSIVSTETLTDDVLLTAVTDTDGAYTFNSKYDTEVSGTRVFKHNSSYSRVVYNDGVISKGTTNFTGGHSVLLCGERSTLTLETVDASTNANSEIVYNLDSGDRTVKLSVQPKVTDLEFTLKNLANSTYSSHTTNVYVKVTLPAGLSYTTASAVWGTTAISPESITTNNDGTSTIIFMLANVTTPGDLDAITFACDITSAENNEEFTVISEIYSTYDQRVRQESFGNYTSVTFFAVTTAIAQVIKSTDTTLIEKNGTLIWNLYYGNNSDIEMPNSRIVDVLPSNGDDLGSDFSGTLTVTEITLDYSNATDLYSEDNKDSVKLYIKTSALDSNVTSSDYGATIVSSDSAPTGFEEVTGAVDEYNHTITYTISSGTTVYAFYFALGTLKTDSNVTVTITATTDGNEAEDSYCNCFYQCYENQAVLTSGTVTSYVANRSLSGLVWIDADGDGVRDDGEKLVNNANVSLYREGDENDNTSDAALVLSFDNSESIYLYKAYTSEGKEITSTTTDENGEYLFESLDTGTYYVVTDSIGTYGVTEKNAGNSDTNDSDADGYCDPTRGNATTLDLAYIADVEILDVAELETYNYINEFNDFGFVDVTGSLTISKIDSLGGGALQNVKFTLAGNGTEETGETNKSGQITFKGITATTADETAVEYTLTESEALTGYNDVSTKWTVTATKKVVDNNLTAIVSVASDDSSFAVVDSDSVSTEGKTSYYTSSTAVLTVENTSYTTDYSATVIWDDNDNQDGKRPKSITVTLTATAGGTTVDALYQSQDVTLSNDTNSYSVDFGDLPLYYNGSKVTYTISTSYQEDEIYSYTLSSTTDATTGDTAYTFTYTHTPETTSVTVTVNWDDEDDQDGVRPESVVVYLYANGETTGNYVTLSAGNSWTATFEDLDVYSSGKDIAYTVQAVADTARSTYYTGSDSAPSGSQSGGYTFTYSHTPETRDIAFTIVWVDDNNVEGFRPEEVTVNLTVSGTNSKNTTADESGSWSGSFTNLDKYSSGTEIAYSVTATIEGYTVKVTGDMANGFTITATRVTSYKEITVTVIWSDNDNAEGHRPESVDVTLSNGTAAIDPITISKSTDDTANTSSSWSSTATLPVYANGREIAYSFSSASDVTYYTKEVTVDSNGNYTITYTLLTTTITLGGTKTATNGANSTNSFTFNLYQTESAEKTSTSDLSTLSTTNVSSAGGSYAFDSITYNEAGTYYYIIEEVSGSVKGWTYDDNVYYVTVTVTQSGSTLTTAISYTSTKVAETATVTATGSTYSFADFTNTKAEATAASVTITATKVIAGATSINSNLEFSLYKDGSTTAEKTATLEGSTEAIETNATITFAALTFTEDEIGNTYTYTVKETNTTVPSGWTYSDETLTFTVVVSFDETTNSVVATVSGTSVTSSGNNTYNVGTFTNKYDTEDVTVTLTASATYEDATGNATVPTFTYSVYASDAYGNVTDSTKATTDTTTSDTTITLGSITFETTGTYYYLVCVEEQDDAAWTADTNIYLVTIVVTDDGKGNLAATIADVDYSDSTYNVGSFTNTYATTSVTATVVWDDDANVEGFRPDEVTITLTDGTNTVDSTTVNADDWSYTFENLDVYSNSDKIPYTVTATIDGYDVVIGGSSDDEFIIAATRETSYKKITVTVTWDDNSDQDGARPKNVNIDLYRNGELLHTLQLTDTEENSAILFSTANVWSYTFTDMSVYAEGEALVYSITPADVDDYELTSCEEDEDGNFAVLYTHEPEEQTITVTNTWVDEDDADGLRGDLVLTLIASDGTEYTGTLAKTDSSYTFTVFTYGDGDVLDYELIVGSLDGYTITAEVTDDGFSLTSTHTVVPTTEATTTETTTEVTTTEVTTTEVVTTEATSEVTTTEATTAEATTAEATTETTTATNAKTDDNTPLAIAFAMMLMGIAGAVVTGKKRGRK